VIFAQATGPRSRRDALAKHQTFYLICLEAHYFRRGSAVQRVVRRITRITFRPSPPSTTASTGVSAGRQRTSPYNPFSSAVHATVSLLHLTPSLFLCARVHVPRVLSSACLLQGHPLLLARRLPRKDPFVMPHPRKQCPPSPPPRPLERPPSSPAGQDMASPIAERTPARSVYAARTAMSARAWARKRDAASGTLYARRDDHARRAVGAHAATSQASARGGVAGGSRPSHPRSSDAAAAGGVSGPPDRRRAGGAQ